MTIKSFLFSSGENEISLMKPLTCHCFCFDICSLTSFIAVCSELFHCLYVDPCHSGLIPTCPFFCFASGMIDCPGTQDGSSLRSLIDKPPVCGNSFSPLTGALLTGFRLHTGPVLTDYKTHAHKISKIRTRFQHADTVYSNY